MKVECGSVEELVSATEPETCRYELVLKTPAVCQEEDIDAAHSSVPSGADSEAGDMEELQVTAEGDTRE